MAKIDIDNVKMWESIRKHAPNWVGNLIEASLKDQGLGFDEKGNIISIMPQNNDFKIEKGKWYVCTKPLLGFYVGDLGYCDCDGDISHRPNATERYHVVNADCFRPATEEEIKENNGGIIPNFKVGDKIRMVLGTKEGIVTKIEKDSYILDGRYVLGFEYEANWELIEPKQENSELTEFESALYGEFYGIAGFKPTAETIKMSAKELLSIARKQIAEELEKSLNMAMVIDKYKVDGYTVSVNWYHRAVNDIIKKIKGE